MARVKFECRVYVYEENEWKLLGGFMSEKLAHDYVKKYRNLYATEQDGITVIRILRMRLTLTVSIKR